MEKPFDFSDLAKKAQAQGVPMAEDVAEKLAGVFFAWVKESLEIHPNQLVKLALPVVNQIEPIVFGQLDKIDGVIGQ